MTNNEINTLFMKINRKKSHVITQISLLILINVASVVAHNTLKEKWSGTKNEICVSLVYSGNGNKISFPFPLYTRETQISFFVPENDWFLKVEVVLSLIERIFRKFRNHAEKTAGVLNLKFLVSLVFWRTICRGY